MKIIPPLFIGTIFYCLSSHAGIMRHDIDVQDYRDFAENLGKYRVGVNNIAVYKKNGEFEAFLNFPMPDMATVSRRGFAGLTAPSYVSSVRHVSNFGSAFFGGPSEYSPRYLFVNHNALDPAVGHDYMLPRLNKVVTEAAPVEHVELSELKAGIGTRYTAFVRAGAGYQRQVNDQLDGLIPVGGAYDWLSGGTINPDIVTTKTTYLYWTQYQPDDPRSSPLSTASQSADSGSPVYAYDSLDKKWKLVAALKGRTVVHDKYGTESFASLLPDGYFASIVAANTSPDVTDNNTSQPIIWNSSTLNQGEKSWGWQGLEEKYRHLAPSAATLAELDASKDLRFNGAGGDIILSEAINLGAGKLQFSNNYTLKSAEGRDATWVGGGVEVDEGKKVLWQVNGLADDDLHKIGAGTLHINAKGNNAGGLNVGDGTVILDQQADAAGHQHAFSRLYITSGRPTVILQGKNQIEGDQIFFGYRGGKLDLHGNDLLMKKINHTDGGAHLVNHHPDEAAKLTLTGWGLDDIALHTWSSTVPGVVGDIYVYKNSRLGGTDYFQLKDSSYWYFPSDRTDNDDWHFIGNDEMAAKAYRASQFNDMVYRGFIGAADAVEVNGKLEINFSPKLATATLALAGGANLDGNINVTNGTLLLSGQPVPHAGGVIIEDDWYASSFTAKKIIAADNTRFQVGEYAQVTADIEAGDNALVSLGYNQSADEQQRILRCTSGYGSSTGECHVAQRSAEQLSRLPNSTVDGKVSLGDNAQLYLGKVNYTGSINGKPSASVNMDSTAFWHMTASSAFQRLNAAQGGIISTLATQALTWTAKQLMVEHLNASNLQIGLGIAPQTGISDSLYIDKSAQGSGNTIDLGFMLGETFPKLVRNDIVLLDAPAGTAHDYFTLSPVMRGFSIYSPQHQVIEENGRVKWVIVKTPEATIDPVPEPKPEPVIDPVPEPKPEPVIDPAPEPKPEPVIDPVPEPGNPEDWFNVSANQALINRTRALLASRHYIINETANTLHDRAGMLRNDPQMSGVWGNVSHNRGGIGGVKINQQNAELGADTQQGLWRLGVMASRGQGSAKGEGSVSHQLSTLGSYATWLADNGWFADIAARYLHLRQDLHLDPALAIQGSQRSSHMLLTGAKLGHRFALSDALTLAPYLETSVGYLPGYQLQGYDVDVKLAAATPWSVTPGIEIKQRGLGAALPGISLYASVSKQFSPGSSGSTLTLADSHASRDYQSWSDNRYRFRVGIEGELSENWSLSVNAKHSSGGNFSTDSALDSTLSYTF